MKITSRSGRSRNRLGNQVDKQDSKLYDWQTERIHERLQEAKKGGDFISHDKAMRKIEEKILTSQKP